jgi:uncharacterized membrane-anchored protein
MPAAGSSIAVPRSPITATAWSKVPAITAYFWLTKILTTGMGEAASDFTGSKLPTLVAMPLAAVLLIASLAWQFRAKKYVVITYWTAVVMVSVFGTMVADAIHTAGISYVVTTTVFSALLAGVFVAWYRTEGTLSIHHITTRRREGFYWATVLSTFALGTAVGDMTAATLHLGYLTSWVLFAVLIAIPAVVFWRFPTTEIAMFWVAYVLTRPLGASIADWLAVPRHLGGRGWGTGLVTLVMSAGIALLVTYLALNRPDVDTA